MKPMSPRKLRNIRERLAHAARPTRITGDNFIIAEDGKIIAEVRDELGWQFWLNAHDDVTALLRYIKTLKRKLRTI